MFLLCLVAEKKVAWILFFVKFSDFYGMAVKYFWKYSKIAYPSLTVFFADALKYTEVCYHVSSYTDVRPEGRHNAYINAVRIAGNVTSMAPREYLNADPWSKYQ